MSGFAITIVEVMRFATVRAVLQRLEHMLEITGLPGFVGMYDEVLKLIDAKLSTHLAQKGVSSARDLVRYMLVLCLRVVPRMEAARLWDIMLCTRDWALIVFFVGSASSELRRKLLVLQDEQEILDVHNG